jgi:hypothetical protein
MDDWGVAYELDENGEPGYVEEADDEGDAHAWAQAQDGIVVRRVVQRGAWTVA